MSAVAKPELRGFYQALSRLVRTYQFRDKNVVVGCGISVAQCHALDVLIENGSLTIQGLANQLRLDKSNASRIVAALEARGLVESASDKRDARVKRARSTPAGNRVNKSIRTRLMRDYFKLLQPFSPAFVQDATVLLNALADRAAVQAGGPRLTGPDRCRS